MLSFADVLESACMWAATTLFNEELGLVVEMDDAKVVEMDDAKAHEAIHAPSLNDEDACGEPREVTVNGAVVLDEDERALQDL